MFKYLVYEYNIKKYNLYKNLLISLKSISGRSNNGCITHYGRGGIVKRYLRLIDFYRYLNFKLPYMIKQFEYDPNRNIFLMLVIYFNGIITYLLTPTLVNLNEIFYFCFFKIGELVPIIFCRSGMFIYNISFKMLSRVKYSRAAGSFSIVLRQVGNYVLLKLKSIEELYLTNNILANLGKISGELNKLFKYLKAGIKTYFGYKSKVRGTAKNPIDHPHGGGAGRTSAGKPSVSPWNLYTKGIRTTKRFKKYSYRLYYKRRTGIMW